MLKYAFIKNKALGEGMQCRCDAKYLIFVSQADWNAFGSDNKTQSLAEIIVPTPIKKVAKGDLEHCCSLVNISDQEPGDGILDPDKIITVEEIQSDKNILSGCDIIVSKLGMPKGYIYILPEINVPIIGSTEFIPYTLKDPDINYFILYLLLSPKMKIAYSALETGKTPSHKRVNPEDFLKIRVPRLDTGANLYKLNSYIKELALKIEVLLKQREKIQEKIELVFSQEFNYDFMLSKQFGKGVSQPTQILPEKGYRITSIKNTSLCQIATLRMSTRFNNEITQKLTRVLHSFPTVKLGSLTLLPIHRGCSPNYKVDGDIPVIKTAHLQNGTVIISDEEFVSSFDYNKDERAQVQGNDLLMASTGKGSIGKVSIVQGSGCLYADSHITVIRINKGKYNPEFALYFLQTVLGYFQIERDYTGCTNQVDIYPDSIAELRVPDILLERQQAIVGKIRAEIMKQEEISAEIVKLRAEIDAIIENAITGGNNGR